MRISKKLISSIILLTFVKTAVAQFDLSKIGEISKNIQSEIDKSRTQQINNNPTAKSESPPAPTSISASKKNLDQSSTASVNNTVNSNEDSSIDKQLNFNQLCEKFKSIEAFSKLALVLKRTDEDLGLPGYLSYTDSFPKELNWNPKALASFTLNKLETIYNKKPFTADDFEVNLAKSFQSCIADLRLSKDYRLFIISGLVNSHSELGYIFKKWVLDTEKNAKSRNLFDAYDEFKKFTMLQYKIKQEQVANRQPVVLGSDGLPVNQTIDKVAPPKIQSMKFLFENPGVRLYMSGFNGKQRMPIDWSKGDNMTTRENPSSTSSTLGMKLSLAALVVDNGDKAVSSTYGSYLSSNIDDIENKTIRLRERYARDKADVVRKDALTKLILDHPFRKEKIASCFTNVEQLKKTKLPNYLNSDKLCTCGVDLSISELQLGGSELDMLKTASLKKEKDWTLEENRVAKLMAVTFPIAIDECVKRQQPRN